MTKTKLGIIGSRTFDNKSRAFFEINELIKINPNINTIVSGGAKGADKLGEDYADEKGLKKIIYKANWKDMSEPCVRKYGKYGEYNALAGFNRNTQIVNDSDIIIAFWDGKSPGTKDSIDKAKVLDKIVKIVYF